MISGRQSLAPLSAFFAFQYFDLLLCKKTQNSLKKYAQIAPLYAITIKQLIVSVLEGKEDKSNRRLPVV